MMAIRRSEERGVANFGWLDSRHSFSFGHYRDLNHMGHGPLRVINEDRVQPGQGFDPHGHRDMEILSYVLEGALEHKDNMGNGSVMRPGDLQRMTAGTGVQHSEYNASSEHPVHFLQIWILPERSGLAPGYEQKTFSAGDKLNRLRLLGSRNGRDGSLTIHSDVELYASVLDAGRSVTHTVAADRSGWLQVARGELTVNGETLVQGDGLALKGAMDLQIEAREPSEILLFDMG